MSHLASFLLICCSNLMTLMNRDCNRCGSRSSGVIELLLGRVALSKWFLFLLWRCFSIYLALRSAIAGDSVMSSIDLLRVLSIHGWWWWPHQQQWITPTVKTATSRGDPVITDGRWWPRLARRQCQLKNIHHGLWISRWWRHQISDGTQSMQSSLESSVAFNVSSEVL